MFYGTLNSFLLVKIWSEKFNFSDFILIFFNEHVHFYIYTRRHACNYRNKDDENAILQCEFKDMCINIINSKSFDNRKFITFHKMSQDVEIDLICSIRLFWPFDCDISDIYHDANFTESCPSFSEKRHWDNRLV